MPPRPWRVLALEERVRRIEARLDSTPEATHRPEERLAAENSARGRTSAQEERIRTYDLDADGVLETPELARVGDPAEIRSLRWDERSRIRFQNVSRTPVEVLWLDYQGAEQTRGTLEPGRKLDQRTFPTHPFLIRDPSTGRDLAVVVADQHDALIVIGDGEDVRREPLDAEPR